MDTHNPGEQKRYFVTKDNHLRYLLYLPAKFKDLPEKRWPVLCFLHGAGEAAKDSDGQEQPIEKLMDHGTPPWHCEINSPLIRDFIVISPQLPARGRWKQTDFERVQPILRTIYDGFRGDTERTYLTGFSYGGEAVFDFVIWAEELAQKEPSRKVSWAALWPVDDANDQARASCPVKRIWLHFGAWKPIPQKDTAKNLELIQAETFRNSYLKTDKIYTDYAPLKYGHQATCVAAYADWRVYEWMLSR
jgi:predicted peptidase